MKSLTRIVAIGMTVAAISVAVAVPANARNIPKPHVVLTSSTPVIEIATDIRDPAGTGMVATQTFGDLSAGGDSDILKFWMVQKPWCGHTYRVDIYLRVAALTAAMTNDTTLPAPTGFFIYAPKCKR